VTPKDQGRDQIIFEALYLHNGARYTHGYNGPPIENHICQVQRSRERWRHINTRKGCISH